MKILPHHISSLFDERYVDRGKAYFQDGMVEISKLSPSSAEANCIGTRRYRVKLTLDGHRLDGNCTCPAFQDFGPCKHMAATAFAIISQSRSAYSPSSRYIQRKAEMSLIERRLMRMKKSELADFILQHMGDDPALLALVGEGDDD